MPPITDATVIYLNIYNVRLFNENILVIGLCVLVMSFILDAKNEAHCQHLAMFYHGLKLIDIEMHTLNEMSVA